jgi:hypothetical protein
MLIITGKLPCLLGVPNEKDKESVMGLFMALPVTYQEANYEVHKSIHLWIAWLRQQYHATLRLVLHPMDALAGQTGPGISHDFLRHSWRVILLGHQLEDLLCAKLPSNGIIVMVPKYLLTDSSSSWNVQLHFVIEEAIMLLTRTLIMAKQHDWNAVVINMIAPREAQCYTDFPHSVILCLTLCN